MADSIVDELRESPLLLQTITHACTRNLRVVASLPPQTKTDRKRAHYGQIVLIDLAEHFAIVLIDLAEHFAIVFVCISEHVIKDREFADLV